jgi:DNA-binding LacI/PurR family transcriptional regulator/DNA-binding transcriptional regulator YhcF (GntR family)
MRGNTPIHVQLRNSLLFEAIGGGYRAEQRFLSNRKICRRWKVSDTTARKSLKWLVEAGILRAQAQSGYFLRANFEKRALLLLHQRTSTKLPSPRSLATSRFKYLPGSGRKQRRVALVWYDDEPTAGVGRLPPKMSATGWDWSQGFFTEAISQGCEVYFFVLSLEEERRRFVLSSIVDEKLDGVAVFSRLQDPGLPTLLRAFAKANIPAIRVFGDSEGIEMPTVNLNNVAMGYTAAKHFLKLGHSRMLVLMDSVRHPYFEKRLEGFRMALEADSRETLLEVVRMPESLERIEALVREPATRPTAIFASRIEQYAQVEPVLKANGLRTPEDFSVITCGGTVQLPEMERAVDSFIIDFSDVGKQAFQRLRETMEGDLREKHTLIEIPLRKQGSVEKVRK